MQNGITLIALIITIIVMLILAGVVLSLAIGERGIFKTAQGAGKNYTEAQNKELLAINNIEVELNSKIKQENNENSSENTGEDSDENTGGDNGGDNGGNNDDTSEIKEGNVYEIADLQEMIENETNPITVPTLSGPSQDGYEVTSSKTYSDSHPNWQGWRAFDGNRSDTFTFYPIEETPGWVCVEFPEKVAVYKFDCNYSGPGGTAMIKILSSNDGENWVSRTGDEYVALNTYEMKLTTTELAKYWKFETLTLYDYYDMQFYAFHK